jgi:hypothetical protein
MPRTDHRTLLNRGRKAGLSTAELYMALASRQPQAGDVRGDAIDSNGMIVRLDAAGHALFQEAPRER